MGCKTSKKINYKTILLFVAMVSFLFAWSACKREKKATVLQRTYRMGFQNFAPDYTLAVPALTMWTQRADAAIISIQVPWDSLYSGTKPQNYINNNFKNLVNYYRSKDFKLWIYIDPANGLDRAADAQDLAALGKSISQPAVQQLYGRFTFLMDSILKPDHLGLALETNAIRGSAPGAIYQGIKTAANNTAALVRAYDKNVKLSISIQADQAWGLLTNSAYIGIDNDFNDFPFIQELGISSYPFFVFSQPQDIPANYYSRLIQNHNIPVFISEGGWSSQQVYNYPESTQKQQDYIIKQSQLLDGVKAIGWFQLTFTDLKVSALPPGINPTINLFTHLGLVDTALLAKPALKSWDDIFAKPLETGY